MYVNTRKVGHAFQPLARPGSDPTLGAAGLGGWRAADPPTSALLTSTPLGTPLSQQPPFLMVGCHRNAEEDQFHGFSHR